MVGLLLAPYNDSMRLGQGFNSFLQEPRLNNAVHIVEDDITTTRGRGGKDISQVVSYTSRFVERISDVVRTMNLSAGSSIKKGTIEVGGNSLSLDETKFASSDLNAIVSVKVVNQTTQLHDNAQFNPIDDLQVTSEEFHNIYGDCYISGFIEGGELHGVVSIKVLEVSKRHQIEQVIKGQINNVAKEFTLTSEEDWSALDSSLSQTETTMSVNWSGGGQIKEESEEWSIRSLFQVAAGFPAKVAQTPQRTWAILTKYDNNRDFVSWAKKNNIVIQQYDGVQQYTSDLLDNYMEWKNNLSRIQDVLANPSNYKIAEGVTGAIDVSPRALVEERKKIKKKMNDIVTQVDMIDKNPKRKPAVVPSPDATWSPHDAPEVAATLLPVRKPIEDTTFQDFQASWAEGFNFVKEADNTTPAPNPNEPKVPPNLEGPIIDPEARKYCGPREVKYVNDHQARFEKKYRFDHVFGLLPGGGSFFADSDPLEESSITVDWPKKLECTFVNYRGLECLGSVSLFYTANALERKLEHNHEDSEKKELDKMTLQIAQGEKICKVIIGTRKTAVTVSQIGSLKGISFLGVETTKGQFASVGKMSLAEDYMICTPPDGFTGLKGFWGERGVIVDRLGAIWGHDWNTKPSKNNSNVSGGSGGIFLDGGPRQSRPPGHPPSYY